jgi:hypothetical protein
MRKAVDWLVSMPTMKKSSTFMLEACRVCSFLGKIEQLSIMTIHS